MVSLSGRSFGPVLIFALSFMVCLFICAIEASDG
jgi:hypothetical protein